MVSNMESMCIEIAKRVREARESTTFFFDPDVLCGPIAGRYVTLNGVLKLITLIADVMGFDSSHYLLVVEYEELFAVAGGSHRLQVVVGSIPVRRVPVKVINLDGLLDNSGEPITVPAYAGIIVEQVQASEPHPQPYSVIQDVLLFKDVVSDFRKYFDEQQRVLRDRNISLPYLGSELKHLHNYYQRNSSKGIRIIDEESKDSRKKSIIRGMNRFIGLPNVMFMQLWHLCEKKKINLTANQIVTVASWEDKQLEDFTKQLLKDLDNTNSIDKMKPPKPFTRAGLQQFLLERENQSQEESQRSLEETVRDKTKRKRRESLTKSSPYKSERKSSPPSDHKRPRKDSGPVKVVQQLVSKEQEPTFEGTVNVIKQASGNDGKRKESPRNSKPLFLQLRIRSEHPKSLGVQEHVVAKKIADESKPENKGQRYSNFEYDKVTSHSVSNRQPSGIEAIRPKTKNSKTDERFEEKVEVDSDDVKRKIRSPRIHAKRSAKPSTGKESIWTRPLEGYEKLSKCLGSAAAQKEQVEASKRAISTACLHRGAEFRKVAKGGPVFNNLTPSLEQKYVKPWMFVWVDDNDMKMAMEKTLENVRRLLCCSKESMLNAFLENKTSTMSSFVSLSKMHTILEQVLQYDEVIAGWDDTELTKYMEEQMDLLSNSQGMNLSGIRLVDKLRKTTVEMSTGDVKKLLCFGKGKICDQAIDLLGDMLFADDIATSSAIVYVSPVCFSKYFDNPTIEQATEVARRIGKRMRDRILESLVCMLPINHNNDHWVLAVICGINNVRGRISRSTMGEKPIFVYIFDSLGENKEFRSNSERGIRFLLEQLSESSSGEQRTSENTRFVHVDAPKQNRDQSCGFRTIWHCILASLCGEKAMMHPMILMDGFERCQAHYPFSMFMDDCRARMKNLDLVYQKGLRHFRSEIVMEQFKVDRGTETLFPSSIENSSLTRIDLLQYVKAFFDITGRKFEEKGQFITDLISCNMQEIACRVLEGVQVHTALLQYVHEVCEERDRDT